MTPVLSVENLQIGLLHKECLYYPSVQTSFEIQPEEFWGLVGESGSGKSITALALLGIHEVYPGILGGSIYYEFSDRPVNLLGQLPEYVTHKNSSLRKDYQGWRKYVQTFMKPFWGKYFGIVFQDSVQALNPYLPVGIQMQDAMNFLNISGEEKKERAIQLLKEVRLRNPEAVYQSFPFELSGGMAQRVMMAIALVGNPEFLVLDEPTFALDVTLQASVTDLLVELRNKRKISGLIISHDLKFVSRVASKIAVMLAGDIWEIGKSEEITHRDFPWKHPYTEYLLKKGELDISAEASDPTIILPGDKDRGCRYRTRCADFQENVPGVNKRRCEAERPPIFSVFGDHGIRCWKFAKAGRDE